MMTGRKIRGCSNPRSQGVKLEEIPLDLVVQKLSKLPAKSIARFRCVSKRWNSTFRSTYFTESFFTISSSQPILLFACRSQLAGNMSLFSSASPQPQSWCPSITVNFHMSFPINCPSAIGRPVGGLVSGNSSSDIFPTEYPDLLICNPSTGQCLTLPKVVKQGWSVVKSCLGYDPIDRQVKLLCMTQYEDDGTLPYPIVEHQVLTLGTGSWRMIKCDIPHFAVRVDCRDFGDVYDWKCINGVLYYFASVLLNSYHGFSHIVCFDIRSEKFSYIRKAQDMDGKLEATLVNYKGKLAKIQPDMSNNHYFKCIRLWVLELDAEKHQWSRYTYRLPSPWLLIVGGTKLRCAGMTNTGEIVWSPHSITPGFFYLVYFNPERNTVTRVGIKGIDAYNLRLAYVFLDYIENVKLLPSI